MYSKKIQKLIDLFSRFPGVGPKTATRFVFFLLNQNGKQEIKDLAEAIMELQESLKHCDFCFKFFEGQGNLCEICSDGSRDRTLLCVVEKETDLVSIENSKIYKGLYFVLGRTLRTLNKEELDDFPLKELKQRIQSPKKFGIPTSFQEIILGLNPTVEGETTVLYLKRELKDLNKKITRLGRGLPVGGELEYADPETLRSALEKRS